MALNPEPKWNPIDYISQLPARHEPAVTIPDWDDAPKDWSLPPLAQEPDDLGLPVWAERVLFGVILAFTVALVVYGIWLGPAVAR